MRRHLSWLLAGGIILLAAASTPARQDNPSFRPVDDEGFQAFEDSVRRLKQSQEAALDANSTRDLIRSLLAGKWSEEELKALQQSLNKDPKLRERMEKELLNDRGLRQQIEEELKNRREPSPEQVKRLQKLAMPSQSQPMPGPSDPPGSSSSPAQNPEAKQAPPRTAETQPRESKRRPSGASSWLQEHLGRWAENLRDQGGGSETLRDAMRQLSRLGLDSRFSANLPNLNDWMPQRWFEGLNLPSTGGLSLPELPQFGGGGSWSVPTSSGGLPSGTTLVLILLIGAVLLALWKGRELLRTPAEVQAGRGWRLGNWPVLPEAVSTRQQLVDAFEYLACRLLGPDAQHWHHRELAARLGDTPSMDGNDRQAAADRLADLYERARYAPDVEPLPAGDLASARRDLCLLAGRASS
jgi:hypothetical protein